MHVFLIMAAIAMIVTAICAVTVPPVTATTGLTLPSPPQPPPLSSSSSLVDLRIASNRLVANRSSRQQQRHSRRRDGNHLINRSGSNSAPHSTTQDISMTVISDGLKRGLAECESQFRKERWNCTQMLSSHSHFQNSVRSSPSALSAFHVNHMSNQSLVTEELFSQASLEMGNKETAFLHAITSAGVVHSVTEACSAGNLSDCSCDRSRLGHMTTSEGWKWGGCSDNVRYGMMFAKHFVDQKDRQARESAKGTQELLRSLMNLHNSEAGRQAVATQMDLKCRCHGISGSCELKTCWRTLPSFRQVGNLLKKKYESAVQISERQMRRKLRKKGKVKRKVIVSVPKEDLVFINKSPNYCVEDRSKGMPGTSGRVCQRSSDGPDSCALLCCGRGYNTKIEKITTRCDCKFEWCCNVQCNVCESENEVYTCK